MTIAQTAEFVATHALVLLASAILLLGVALLIVLAAARAASRHRDTLWAAADVILPGRGLRPTAYLATHLVSGLLVVLAGMGFLALADEVFENEEIAAFDAAFAEALYAEVSPAWRRVFAAITMLGNGYVLTAASTAIAVFVFIRRGRLLGYAWVFSQAGGALLTYGLKIAFERARPPYADPDLAARSFSFPSGHAMLTFVFSGMAAYLLIRTRRSWSHGAALAALVLAWSILMGFSRLYLGQHYLSDVIAGLSAGTAWVAACVAGTEVALRRSAARPGARTAAS